MRALWDRLSKENGAQGVLVLIDYINHQHRLDVYIISGEIFPQVFPHNVI